MPIPEWPVGPTFFAEQLGMRPYLPSSPPPLFPYRDWGRAYPTTVWQEAGRCRPREAAQASDSGWYAELIRDRHTPNVAKPYLERNEWPPEPGGAEYFADIKPYFRYGRLQEQHYIDWWYEHFTSDSPGSRYTLPSTSPSTPAETPEEPTRTITTTGEPVTTTSARRTPWGWVVGGSALLLLVGGGVAYYLTRPKRKRDGGRRRRSRR